MRLSPPRPSLNVVEPAKRRHRRRRIRASPGCAKEKRLIALNGSGRAPPGATPAHSRKRGIKRTECRCTASIR